MSMCLHLCVTSVWFILLRWDVPASSDIIAFSEYFSHHTHLSTISISEDVYWFQDGERQWANSGNILLLFKDIMNKDSTAFFNIGLQVQTLKHMTSARSIHRTQRTNPLHFICRGFNYYIWWFFLYIFKYKYLNKDDCLQKALKLVFMSFGECHSRSNRKYCSFIYVLISFCTLSDY